MPSIPFATMSNKRPLPSDPFPQIPLISPTSKASEMLLGTHGSCCWESKKPPLPKTLYENSSGAATFPSGPTARPVMICFTIIFPPTHRFIDQGGVVQAGWARNPGFSGIRVDRSKAGSRKEVGQISLTGCSLSGMRNVAITKQYIQGPPDSEEV